MTAVDKANHLSPGTYGWGWLVFGYGLIWLMVLAVGFLLIDNFIAPGETVLSILLAAAVTAALAGGLGGATAMLQNLGQQLSTSPGVRLSFLAFLVQPFTGLIAGVLSLFVVSLPGALLVNYAATRSLSLADLVASTTFVALYLLLAWIAGYLLPSWWGKKRGKPTVPAAQPPPASPLAFKLWAEKRRRMSRWAVTWGSLIFVYGVVWLIVLLASLLRSDLLFPVQADGNQPLVNLLAAGWPALLAGGIGG